MSNILCICVDLTSLLGTGLPTTVGPSGHTGACARDQPTSFTFEYTSGPTPCQKATITVISTPPYVAPIPPLSFWVIYPGGQSFPVTIPAGDTTSVDWVVNVASGEQVLFAMGDARSPMSGRTSNLYTIPPSANQTCIDSNSPHVTPGPPAGQVVTAISSPSATLTQTPSVSRCVILDGSRTFINKHIYSCV